MNLNSVLALKLIRLSLIALAFATPVHAGDLATADEVLDCAAQNAPEKSFRQGAEFVVHDKQGSQRRISASFAGLRPDQGMMLNIGVKSPADIAGTAVLLKRDDTGREMLKIYLPALRRVRNVSGSMSEQGVFGTDFSYQDLRELFGAFREGEAVLRPGETVDDRNSYKISLNPGNAGTSRYKQIELFIDKEYCVALRIDFIGDDNKLQKQLNGDFASLNAIGSRKLLFHYTMNDVNSGSLTQLSLGEPVFDSKIRKTAFSPGNFYEFHNRVEIPESK